MSRLTRLRLPPALTIIVLLLVIGFISVGVSRSKSGRRARAVSPPSIRTGHPAAPKSSPVKERPQVSADEEFEKIKQKFPKVEYDSPEPSDPAERIKRHNKGKQFDNGYISKKPTRYSSSLSNDWYAELPALPMEQSNAVVIADTLSRGAFLSNDKTGVYTELAVRIEQVVKGNDLLQEGRVIDINRPGGVVRYSSGEESLFYIEGQGMPIAGKRYLLFLKAIPDNIDFQIITGYELSPLGVRALDSPSQFAQFNGLDEITFLLTVRNTVAQKK